MPSIIFYVNVSAMTGNKVKAIKFTPVNTGAREKLDFKAGDTVRVWSRIPDEKANKNRKKGDTEMRFRSQAFEGMILARKHGVEPGATFTVRKVASGVGVERVFPLYSPNIEKIEVTKRAKSRRSKLYYVRDKAVKEVRKKLRAVTVALEDTVVLDAKALAAEEEARKKAEEEAKAKAEAALAEKAAKEAEEKAAQAEAEAEPEAPAEEKPETAPEPETPKEEANPEPAKEEKEPTETTTE